MSGSVRLPISRSGGGARIAAALAAATITAGLAFGLAGCAAGKPAPVPSDDAAEPSVTVMVIDNRFEPAEVEIEAGQAVRWVFAGRDRHDVVADDGGFVSELITEGEYTHLFVKAGEFGYDCSIHPEMRGTVTVR